MVGLEFKIHNMLDILKIKIKIIQDKRSCQIQMNSNSNSNYNNSKLTKKNSFLTIPTNINIKYQIKKNNLNRKNHEKNKNRRKGQTQRLPYKI